MIPGKLRQYVCTFFGRPINSPNRTARSVQLILHAESPIDARFLVLDNWDAFGKIHTRVRGETIVFRSIAGLA